MADITRVATTALTSAAVGFVTKASPLVIKGTATEFITAGAIGIAGLFGAFMSKGKMCEDVSIGAVNGVTSYLGIKMAEMIKPTATTTQATTPTTGYSSPVQLSPMPRLVGYGNEGAGARAARSSMLL